MTNKILLTLSLLYIASSIASVPEGTSIASNTGSAVVAAPKVCYDSNGNPKIVFNFKGDA